MSSLEEDQRNIFFAMLGSSCDDARLGDVCVHLELEDGTVIKGIPAEAAVGVGFSAEIDHSGTRALLTVGETIVDIAQVQQYTIVRPGS